MDIPPIVIRNRSNVLTTAKTSSQINKARRDGAVVEVHMKGARGNKAHIGTDGQKLSKLDRENESRPPPVIEQAFIDAVTNGRAKKGLTREELARMVNEPVSVISKCETPGSLKPDLKVIPKLEKALETILRGTNIGQKKVMGKKVKSKTIESKSASP